ncbi:MAG: type III-B CRISPR module RAMP protein Cmr4 [Pseudomonadota bacterium]|nr:type III-B CRISPR module RAMP protein Cmr4 [Pseudomonadota bacterium]
MFKEAKPLFLICETPLHVGSGDDLGIIDLPIQRERHTGFPKVESSSLKGSLRTVFEEKAGEDVNELIKIQATFGYDEAGLPKTIEEAFTLGEGDKKELKSAFVGCLGFTDARLLLFPVKSMKGVFAWITCPQVLRKFADEMRLCKYHSDKIKLDSIQNIAENIAENTVPNSCELLVENKQNKKQIVLEEFTFEVNHNEQCDQLANCLANVLFSEEHQYWKEKLRRNLVILPHDDFRDFVEHSTEVITRTKIDNETGTVKGGALFTEEFLPTDSILYSLVLASSIAPMFLNEKKFVNSGYFSEFSQESAVIGYFKCALDNIKNIFQLGGNATLGKGIVRMIFLNNEENKEE